MFVIEMGQFTNILYIIQISCGLTMQFQGQKTPGSDDTDTVLHLATPNDFR